MAAGRCGHQADGQSVGVADRERAAGRCGNWADGGNMADGWRKAQAGAEVRPAAIGRIGRGGGRADRQGWQTGGQVQTSGQAGAAGTGVTGSAFSMLAGGTGALEPSYAEGHREPLVESLGEKERSVDVARFLGGFLAPKGLRWSNISISILKLHICCAWSRHRLKGHSDQQAETPGHRIGFEDLANDVAASNPSTPTSFAFEFHYGTVFNGCTARAGRKAYTIPVQDFATI
ncbi:hypothetical protein GGX14DRAFT_664587 [Mycena pura]|uniref:Uncharacterized protein n=1 Tax=Mycena pura TaxID=153505 RepID=A0AAD6V729_9AGAR|nr:hypothetical protein GGX14DRAFT_664587 [Mycena pura]